MILYNLLQRMGRVSKAIPEERLAKGDVSKEAVHHSERFRGKHEINYEICTGCDACNKICPVDAIKMAPLPLKKPNKIPEVNLSICIFCGLCEDVCPTKPEKAIKLSGGDFDMLTGGYAADQADYWAKVEVPEQWISDKQEEEKRKAEAAAKKKAEAKAKKEAEAKAKKEAEAAEEPASESETKEG